MQPVAPGSGFSGSSNVIWDNFDYNNVRYQYIRMRLYHEDLVELDAPLCASFGNAVHSETFKRTVQEALRPVSHDTEEFVVKRDWSAYDGTRSLPRNDIGVVLTLQASPDRCATA